ncbi:hypothetical protein TNCV_1071381 [Trichonephila clavipes]|nr:hypothetical protein TNCV_1071381 [Trichonephila clavipes]
MHELGDSQLGPIQANRVDLWRNLTPLRPLEWSIFAPGKQGNTGAIRSPYCLAIWLCGTQRSNCFVKPKLNSRLSTVVQYTLKVNANCCKVGLVLFLMAWLYRVIERVTTVHF